MSVSASKGIRTHTQIHLGGNYRIGIIMFTTIYGFYGLIERKATHMWIFLINESEQKTRWFVDR